MTGETIDLDHLEKYVAGDNELRNEILQIFAEQVDNLLKEFDVFQTDDDWQNTAHTLKGAARGVGAWKLGQVCEEAEKLSGLSPAKQEARATALVSIRHFGRTAIEDARTLCLLKEAV